MLGAEAYALLSRQASATRGGGARVWRAGERGEWAAQGSLPTQGLDARCQSQPGAAALFDAVREGRVASVPPPQRDLSAGGLRFPVQRWGRADGCD